MTVQNTTAKVREDGDAIKSVFSFPFKVFSNADIEVSTIVKSTGVATLKVLTTDYTVSINAITDGGTITYVTTVPSALEEFFAVRVVPDTQPTDIPNVGSIRESQIETPLDRRTMVSQQQQEALDRTLKFASTSEQSSIDVPEPEADKALFWNALATGLENRSLDVTSGTFPGDFDAGLDANKAAVPSTNDLYLATDTFRMYRCFSSGVWSTKQVFAEEINLAQGADIASATTTDIGAATGNFIDVTGTTTITGLGTIQAGTTRTVRFTGILTLTHNATSLILPGGASITTAANDRAMFVSLGGGNWICVFYMKADGTPIVTGAVAASQAEMEAGTELTKFVSPGRQQFHPSAAKAWATFDGTVGTPAISGGYNLDASVTDNSAGNYTVSFTTDFSAADYVLVGSASRVIAAENVNVIAAAAQAVGTAVLSQVTGSTDAATDSERVSFVVYGDQ